MEIILSLALLGGALYLFTIMVRADMRKEELKSKERLAAKEHDAKFKESEKEESGPSKIANFKDIVETKQEPTNPVLDKIQEAKQLLDAGIINDEEFSAIKDKLISQM